MHKRKAVKNLYVGRKQPYTDIGIKRVSCAKCGYPSDSQWQVCANGNRYQGLCVGCDIELNALTLNWMKHPNAERLIAKYRVKQTRPFKNAATLAYEIAAKEGGKS